MLSVWLMLTNQYANAHFLGEGRSEAKRAKAYRKFCRNKYPLDVGLTFTTDVVAADTTSDVDTSCENSSKSPRAPSGWQADTRIDGWENGDGRSESSNVVYRNRLYISSATKCEAGRASRKTEDAQGRSRRWPLLRLTMLRSGWYLLVLLMPMRYA